MQKNEIGKKPLSADAQEWIEKMHRTMTIKEYGAGSVKSYVNEMTLLFKHCNHLPVEQIRQETIEEYLMYIKDVHKIGRAKCRSVAQACSFFLSG